MEKKLLKSVSVMVEGRPPRKTYINMKIETLFHYDLILISWDKIWKKLTLGYPLLFLGFCILLGLHALGSMVLPSKLWGHLKKFKKFFLKNTRNGIFFVVIWIIIIPCQHSLDSRWIFKCNKSKTSWPVSPTIFHDHTINYFTKLRKIS